MLKLPAPAKLNLFLHITGRRDDGYHNLQTLFQFIDFVDDLIFSPRKDSQIFLQTNAESINNDDNLIIKAAQLLREKTGCQKGIDIYLEKNLPMGAGLGGGSSDAATTLLGLNALWNCKLSLDELAELGVTLGADVPVFVHGFAAWAEGIGDKLTPMQPEESCYLIIIPPCHISSDTLYKHPDLKRDTQPIAPGDYQFERLHNDFESLAREEFPLVAQALDWLSQYSLARMTGSGSVVFAKFDTREEAGKIASLVPAEFDAVVAKGLNQSPLHRAIAELAK